MQPRPGSVGAFAAILDDAGHLLVVQEGKGRRRFGFPGGRIEEGEEPESAVIRECLEETGLSVRVDYLVGTYRFTNGFEARIFRCSVMNGVAAIQDPREVASIGWIAPNAIPSPNLSPDEQRRWVR